MEDRIQSFWIGRKLSNNEIMCLNSYIAHGHDFFLYVYKDIENVPKGVTLLDANDIISEEKVFKDNAGTFASFADWFRVKMLFMNGGWWVDMDSICLRRFDFKKSCCIGSERTRVGYKKVVNNGFLKFPAKNPIIKLLLDEIEKKIIESEIVYWGQLGVFLFRKCVNQHPHLFEYIAEPEVFCPIDFFDLSSLICKSDIDFGKETYAVHLWNEVWNRGELCKNAEYHPESIYEKLKKMYL